MGNSVREITQGLAQAFLRVSQTVQDGPTGRKLSQGHLVNAIVYGYIRLPPDEQIEHATLWLAELETILAETDEEKREAKRRLASVKRQAKPDGLLGSIDLAKIEPPAPKTKRRPKPS